MPNLPSITDVDWLRQRYEVEQATLDEIAQQVGCSISTVSRTLRRLGIDTIPAGTKRAARGNSAPGSYFEQLRNREWLAESVTAGRSLKSIADEVGATTITVRKALRRHGLFVPREPRATYDHNPGVGTCEQCGEAYERTSPAQRWCKPGCREAAHANGVERRNYHWDMPERACLECGRTFKPAGSRQEYCTADCRTEARRSEERPCLACGKLFRPTSGDGAGNFCSVGCRYAARTGENVRITEDGYVEVRHNGRFVKEHRLVMEQKLGRPLLPTETVHHIDGVHQNNDESNLQLRSGNHGKGVVLRCLDCGGHNIVADEIAPN